MIRFDRVTYRYPDRGQAALDALDFHLAAGDMSLIAGASGSGKSTLLRMLNGLTPHFHGGRFGGQIEVFGRNPAALGPRGMSDLVGLVAQDPESQFVAEIVEDELAFAMENHGLPASIMRRRIEEALDLLSIAHLRGRRVDTLSGGERQRVAIAAVLTLQPTALALDEPTSQLDPQAAEDVFSALQRLNQDLGMTVLLSEHRVERAVQHVDSVLLLRPGAPAATGAPEDILVQTDQAPPLTRLAAALGWRPLPLTLKQARRHPDFAALLRDAAARAGEPIEPAETEPAATATNLWIRHANGIEALKGVDFVAQRGRLTALAGRNGSGKTTLLKALAGLVKPYRGGSALWRKSGEKLDPARMKTAELARTVGFVPQNAARLLFHDTAYEELAYTLRRANQSPERAHEWLRRFGLDGRADSHPRDLSVGERQRLALAAIIAGEPEVLLLDEPTRGLDTASKKSLAALLRELRQSGVAVVMATHDMELAAECADRIAVLGEGRLVVEGPVRQVMNESLTFSTQVNKLFRAPEFLTAEDVLRRVSP